MNKDANQTAGSPAIIPISLSTNEYPGPATFDELKASVKKTRIALQEAAPGALIVVPTEEQLLEIWNARNVTDEDC